MSKRRQDQDEQELLEAYESGDLRSQLTPDRRRSLEQAAEEAGKKDKRINVRISSRDLAALRRRALEEGIPYQTLISSVLHKYVSGSLRDLNSEKPLRTSGQDQ